jgi:choline dehydrogenase
MLSGVGPAKQLQEHGIPVIQDLPGVGANLVDHPVVDLYLKDKKNASARILQPKDFSGALHLIRALAQYQLFGTGKLATNVSRTIYQSASVPPLTTSLVRRIRRVRALGRPGAVP